MDAMTGFPKEIELKLDLAPGGADALVRLMRLWSGAEPKVEILAATYYDTPDQALRKAGVAVRVRREGGRWVQTAKAGAPGSLQRFEWEAETAGANLELDLLADTPIGELLGAESLGAGLEPAFSVEVTRTSWMLAAEGAAIEVSLDLGEARAGDRAAPIQELELELKAGQAAALFGLARSIAENIDLTVSFITKAERGYALLANTKPLKVEKAVVRRGMSAAEALQAVMRSGLRQLTGNAALLVSGEYDPSALHQARVAMRRLRAILDLYGPALDDGRSSELGEALRALGNVLGEARNLDVFDLGAGPAATASSEPSAEREVQSVATLQTLVGERRAAAHAGAVEALRANHFRSLLLDAVEWLETGAWLSASPALEGPVDRFAEGVLEHQLKTVHKRGRGLAALDAHHRHRLRIACKKLRYGLEVFAPAAKGKARTRQEALVKRLRPLQEVLGQLNDIATSETFMADLAADASPVAAYTAGRLACTRHAAEAGLLAELEAQWARFRKLEL